MNMGVTAFLNSESPPSEPAKPSPVFGILNKGDSGASQEIPQMRKQSALAQRDKAEGRSAPGTESPCSLKGGVEKTGRQAPHWGRISAARLSDDDSYPEHIQHPHGSRTKKTSNPLKTGRLLGQSKEESPACYEKMLRKMQMKTQ